MKRQSLIRKDTRRSIHLVVALIGLVIAYIVASVVTWSMFNVQSRAERDEVQSTLRKQAQAPVGSLADRQTLQSNLTTKLDAACEPSGVVAWQVPVLPALARNVEDCESSLKTTRQALATYRLITDYRTDYEFITRTVADADRKSRQLPASETERQYEIWNQAATAVTRNAAVDEIAELQDAIAVGLRGVADAWEDVQQVNSYDDIPAAYDALASTQLRIDSALPGLNDRFKAELDASS